jgi:hypothetical protein
MICVVFANTSSHNLHLYLKQTQFSEFISPYNNYPLYSPSLPHPFNLNLSFIAPKQQNIALNNIKAGVCVKSKPKRTLNKHFSLAAKRRVSTSSKNSALASVRTYNKASQKPVLAAILETKNYLFHLIHNASLQSLINLWPKKKSSIKSSFLPHHKRIDPLVPSYIPITRRFALRLRTAHIHEHHAAFPASLALFAR